MNEFVLILHSCLRLAIVAFAVIVFVRAVHGLATGRMFGRGDRLMGTLLVAAADLQLLVGLGLYFVWSPTAMNALKDMGAAMKDPTARRVAVEHPTMMVAALVLLHVGNALRKRVETDVLRFRWVAITVGVALLLIAIGTSWPWSATPVPWLRTSGAG